MSRDALNDRREGLEAAFFVKHNRELLERMREKTAHDSAIEALREASGLENDAVLEELVGLDVRPDTLAALGLVPLLQVAWADHELQAAEKDVILDAAAAVGISRESDAYALLENWLREPPGREMLDAWKSYIDALAETASPSSIKALEAVTLGRATAVAVAAGGFLGIGAMRDSERKVIRELSAAFPHSL